MVLACPVVGPAIPLVQMCDLGAGGGGGAESGKVGTDRRNITQKRTYLPGKLSEGRG